MKNAKISDATAIFFFKSQFSKKKHLKFITTTRLLLRHYRLLRTIFGHFHRPNVFIDAGVPRKHFTPHA